MKPASARSGDSANYIRKQLGTYKSGERKDARLSKPVPLYWVYVTAWATPDGVTQFREDIYNRDGTGPAASTSAKPTISARAVSGFCRMRTVISVMTPSRPSEPVMMPIRS